MKTKMGTIAMLISAWLISENSLAQQTKKSSWYIAAQQAFWLDNKELKIQPMVSGGLEWKGWNTGLAVAADFFSVRSLQLTAELHKKINIGKQSFFVYTNPGMNIVWPNKNSDYTGLQWYKPNQHFSNGYYLEAGAGILLLKNKNLLLGIGWSRKTYTEKYDAYLYNPNQIDGDFYRAKNIYEFNRIGLKMGYRF
ncbi:MAG: hypothetical protein WAT19_01380 [Ferruginibacter sp.]